jgi:hypothetical protein
MTDQEQETTPAADKPGADMPAAAEAGSEAGALADEPIPEAAGGAGAGFDEAGRGREWLNQLEVMIQDVATQAAPVARQIAAKAAELAAAAAVKAGPIAQRAAEVTTDVGQRFAERAQAVATELRAEEPGEHGAASAGGTAGAAGGGESHEAAADTAGEGDSEPKSG